MRDKTEHDDAEGQQDALSAIDIGDRAQTARGDIDKDDDREHDRPAFDGTDKRAFQRRTGHQAFEKQTRCFELYAEIGYAEDEGDDDGEDAHRVGAVVGAEHLARGDKTVAFA